MPKSMSRRAKDEDGEGAARRAVAVVMKALEAKLGDEDFAKLCDRLCDAEPEAEAAEDVDPSTEFSSPMQREMDDEPAKDRKRAKDKKIGKDTPPPFEGKPSTGTAMDAANDKRFDFLRDAQRVKPGQPGAAYGDVSSKAVRNLSTSTSFDAMYPHASTIKVRA